MVDAPKNALAKLAETAARLHNATTKFGAIERARDLPDSYARTAGRVEITAPYHIPDSDRARIKRSADEAKSLVVAKERLRGEIERDAELKLIAHDMEAMRSYLPNLAAQAAIELGEIARALVAEVEG